MKRITWVPELEDAQRKMGIRLSPEKRILILCDLAITERRYSVLQAMLAVAYLAWCAASIGEIDVSMYSLSIITGYPFMAELLKFDQRRVTAAIYFKHGIPQPPSPQAKKS